MDLAEAPAQTTEGLPRTGQKHPPQTARGLPRTGQKQTRNPGNAPAAHGSSRVNQAKTTAQPPKRRRNGPRTTADRTETDHNLENTRQPREAVAVASTR